MTEFKFTTSEFIIRNISPDKSLRVLNTITLNPGERYDLLKLPGVTESLILDALRKPSGALYRDIVERRQIRIESTFLFVLNNSAVGFENLVTGNSGSDGQILSLQSGKLAWVNQAVPVIQMAPAAPLEADAPLYRDGDTIRISKAGVDSNGYLSKEDWLLFKGKSNGWRVWRYQDFENLDTPSLKITSFGEDIPFNQDYIINGSAVITDLSGNCPKSTNHFLWKFKSSNRVFVQSHNRDRLVLNQLPVYGTYRVYFLISIPDGMNLPENVAVPKYIRTSRIELLNSTDIDSGGVKTVLGDKSFVDEVSFSNKVKIISPGGSLDVDGKLSSRVLNVSENATDHYVMTSNSVGDGNWKQSPCVGSEPPSSPYFGQLWVKMPEYELFIYDRNRECWLGTNMIQISGGKNSPSCSDSYLKIYDNISMQNSSLVLPFDCILTTMSASCDSDCSWSAEVHVNSRWQTDCRINISNSTSGYNDNLNVSFSAGSSIQLFASGTEIGMPLITAWFRKKYG